MNPIQRDFLLHAYGSTASPPPNLPLRWAPVILLLTALALLAYGTGGCSTSVTRTITTDKGGRVTDVTVTSQGVDPAALALVEVVTAVYLPRRPLLVREEKSDGGGVDGDLRRVLHGWRGRRGTAMTGPVATEEIQNRWRAES